MIDFILRYTKDSSFKGEPVIHINGIQFKSIFGIRYYFWEKYSQNPALKKKLDKRYHLMLLGDAHKSGDPELADQAMTFFKINKIKLSLNHYQKFGYLINCSQENYGICSTRISKFESTIILIKIKVSFYG